MLCGVPFFLQDIADWAHTYKSVVVNLETTGLHEHQDRVVSIMLGRVGCRRHGVGLNKAGLRETAARYRLSVTKEARSWFPDLHTRPNEWVAPFPAEQLVYIVQDIEIPYAIMQQQRPHIQAIALSHVVRIENEALPALAAMEMRGACIDVERWRGILQCKQEHRQALEPSLIETFGTALRRANEEYQATLHLHR